MRTGYVEAVAVDVDRHRRGHAITIMSECERIIRAAYQLGALSASDAAANLYSARGWLAWPGPTGALTPRGIVPTPDEDGSTYVFPIDVLRLEGMLVCDWRAGDVW